MKKKVPTFDQAFLDQVAAEQNGRCGICNEPIDFSIPRGRKGGHVVDHDHETWLVRGLLCLRCNLLDAWGNRSLKVAAYLADPPALRVGERKYHGRPPITI